jgi:AP2-like factor (euAP2 lineage)
LNNLRENLELTTHTGNQRAYRTPRTQKTSRFRGVFLHRKAQKWQAGITVDNKSVYLGLFLSEEAAARARDAAALRYFGAIAQLNFPKPVVSAPKSK